MSDVIKAWTTVTSASCEKNGFRLWIFLIIPRSLTEPLGVIHDSPICNPDVFRDLALYDEDR